MEACDDENIVGGMALGGDSPGKAINKSLGRLNEIMGAYVLNWLMIVSVSPLWHCYRCSGSICLEHKLEYMGHAHGKEAVISCMFSDDHFLGVCSL